MFATMKRIASFDFMAFTAIALLGTTAHTP
jgi:hypothetical protein